MLSDEDETELITEPPTQKLKTTIDLEWLKLSDIEINFSQRLLKSKFPEISGLESNTAAD